ncbi:MAG: glycosyltransferase family 4 protein [Syntrophaceticus sp.]|nr:glycosyltransferase family 4 protein [Syntrophaceticus sp.]MDD3314907.1 glycosyltransferase family 4 protein [Syntrophaceticus sp.]MDD4359394.1 glycosyltransferase family 4 protein [Syntrophaceticus sp.]MDD4782483.1 glycosyltransferase family 4 protein [Syntrophaceticus sp.]
MKIGIFSDSYRPYVSGVVLSIETFSKELARLGHEIFIFAPDYPQVKGKESNVFRFPSFHTPINPEFYIALPIFKLAREYVSDIDFDLIHVHSPFTLGQVGIKTARHLDIPVVFTYHTLYDQYMHYAPLPGQITKAGMVKYTTNFCNRCNLVITPTGVIKEMIVENGVKKPVVSIPTGIYTDRFQNGDPDFLSKQFGVPRNKQIFLFVGRIGKEKNLSFLLRAFAHIARQEKDAVLVLVGSGPEQRVLQNSAADLGIGDKVIFTGKLHPETIAGAYSSADIFAFPSVTETQGLVLVEAMAAGLPVVAKAAYGSLAMVQDGVTGYLCKGDEQEFAEKALSILHDPERKIRMSAAALKRADELTADKMALRMESAYQAITAGDYETLRQMGDEA